MLNSCSFIGRLGKDVESVNTTSGTSVSKFSLACSEKYKGKETTEWINCVTFGKTAEFAAKYLQKGALIYVSGKMNTQKWQDKSGNDRYTTQILVNDLQSLSSKSVDQQKSNGGHDFQSSGEEDVPF
jgi:single-strand DNA-binding protein